MSRLLLALYFIFAIGYKQANAQDKEERQVPRFAFLKSDKVNVRQGPTATHDVAFIYKQAGLPVEITAEYENWRRIRDWEGSEGWVQHTMLAGGKRSVMVLPSPKGMISVYKNSDLKPAIVAQVEPRVVATAVSCNMQACFVKHKDFEGYIPQNQLWGVYANEKF
jgi:SH3-like domain-containing protein